MPVSVVTDSTSDLSLSLASENGITVAPLNVHFGDEAYRDGVDMSADDFYERLTSSPVLPKTSQPSVGDFLQIYEDLGPGSDGIVSVHIAAKLSGTYNSAINAAQSYDSRPVEVIDTGTASMGLGLCALAAARAAQAGGSVEEVAVAARSAAERIQVFFYLETLHYLEKGGRIGKAQAFVGSLLRVRPVLICRDGEIHPLDKARTRSKAMARVVQAAQDVGGLQEAAVMHSTAPDDAEALAGAIRDIGGGELQILTGRIGPVVGTYAGPGAVGAAVLAR